MKRGKEWKTMEEKGVGVESGVRRMGHEEEQKKNGRRKGK